VSTNPALYIYTEKGNTVQRKGSGKVTKIQPPPIEQKKNTQPQAKK